MEDRRFSILHLSSAGPAPRELYLCEIVLNAKKSGAQPIISPAHLRSGRHRQVCMLGVDQFRSYETMTARSGNVTAANTRAEPTKKRDSLNHVGESGYEKTGLADQATAGREELTVGLFLATMTKPGEEPKHAD